MSPRTLIGISLGALVPVWIYALLVQGGLYVALTSTVSVLLVVASLYVVFGPHEGAHASEQTDADSV